jgi:peptide/nickel transport system ATP-binding protein
VACHWAEDIASGEIAPHEVTAEVVEAGYASASADDGSPFGPASVSEF